MLSCSQKMREKTWSKARYSKNNHTDSRRLTLMAVSSRSTVFPFYVCLSWRQHPGADRPLTLLGNEGTCAPPCLSQRRFPLVRPGIQDTDWFRSRAFASYAILGLRRYPRAILLHQTDSVCSANLAFATKSTGSTVGRPTTLVRGIHMAAVIVGRASDSLQPSDKISVGLPPRADRDALTNPPSTTK
jgi:hypothetical protein